MNFHEIVAKFKHYWYNKKHLQGSRKGSLTVVFIDSDSVTVKAETVTCKIKCEGVGAA